MRPLNFKLEMTNEQVGVWVHFRNLIFIQSRTFFRDRITD